MALGDGVTWNEALPDDTVLANLIDDYHRDLMVAVRSRIAREHIWASSQTATNEGGHHNFITLQAQTAAPTMAGTTAGGVYVGASSAGYPFMFVHSDGTAVTLVNSAKGIPIITTGTQGSIVIASSAAPSAVTLLPAGTTADYVLTTQTTTGAPSWKNPDTLITRFGAWVDKSADYAAQQAATDGFVCAGCSSDGDDGVTGGYTDSASNPTTLRAQQHVNATGNSQVSIMFPVKKGDYWKVVFSGGASSIFVYWIPSGV